MEPLDDFDSLLKAAAGKYDNEPLTEQYVSKMIDERLTRSRKNLISAFKTEIVLITVCVFFLTLTLILPGSHDNSGKSGTALLVVYTGTILYLLVSLFLFIRLMYMIPLRKANHIRDYVMTLYKKTQNALQIYLWLSNIAGLSLVIALSMASQRMNWYAIFFITVLFGVVIHYTNIWYIKKRFGRRLDDIKALVAEFNP